MGVDRSSSNPTTGASGDADDFVAGRHTGTTVPTTRKIARTGQRLSTRACSSLPGGAQDAQRASQGEWMNAIEASVSSFFGPLNWPQPVQTGPLSLNFKNIETLLKIRLGFRVASSQIIWDSYKFNVGCLL